MARKPTPKTAANTNNVGDSVREVTTDMIGSEVIKNADGTPTADAEIEHDRARRIGAMSEDSVVRNRTDSRNIRKARQGEKFRWGEDDARVMFENVRKVWPSGIKIYVRRVEPDQVEYRPVDVSQFKDSTAFYDFVLKNFHGRSRAARYSCAFRDGVERGKSWLNLPDTIGEEGAPMDRMSGLPYPPFYPGYYPQGTPYGYPPQAQGYPPPPAQGYPQAPPQPAPQAYAGPAEPPAPPPPPPQSPSMQYPQQAFPPFMQAPAAPPAPAGPSAAEQQMQQQMATVFWQLQQNAEIMRNQQLQNERLIAVIESRGAQQAPPPPVPQPPVPQPSAGMGFAHMPPPQPPGYPQQPGFPPPGFQQQAPGFQPGYQPPPPPGYQMPPQPGYQAYQQPVQPPQAPPPGYPPGYQPQPPGGATLGDMQRQLQDAIAVAGSLNQTVERFRSIFTPPPPEEPEVPPAMPGVSPDDAMPFGTMPLGLGPDAPTFAYNKHDGSPHILGTLMANGPRIASFFGRIADTVAKAQQLEQQRNAANAMPVVNMEQVHHPAPQQQQQPPQPQPPQAPPQQPRSGLPIGGIQHLVNGGGR